MGWSSEGRGHPFDCEGYTGPVAGRSECGETVEGAVAQVVERSLSM